MLLCKTTILQTGLPPPASAKKNFKRIVLTGITLCLVLCVIFSFAACLFGGDDDADPTTPGQTEPETPSSDSDNPDNSNDNDDDSWDDVIVPDDPVIDPDLPTDPEIPGEPEDPVINPDPSDPTDPINPGDGDTSDFPKSIYEVDEIDEINYFADEFIQIVNKNYGDSFAKRVISFDGTYEDLTNATWFINNPNMKNISQIGLLIKYIINEVTYFSVATITFDNEYPIQAILNNDIPNITPNSVTRILQLSIATDKISKNLTLGTTVISTIDPDNTLEGDIWCRIGSASPSNGKTYRPITVYQITENGVEEYYMVAEAPSADPTSIIANILEGKYTTTSQSTEYTFTGMKIEQIPLPEEA